MPIKHVGYRMPALLTLLLTTAPALAGSAREGDQLTTTRPAEPDNSDADRQQLLRPCGLQPPKPGPKFFHLRYGEDFSYLEGEPGSYREDLFDPIKYVSLGDNWRLTVGGEFRFRLEAETNFAFDAVEPTQDTFELFRYLLHFDLKYRRTARVFWQVASMHAEKRDRADRPLDENLLALQQVFVDVRPLGDDTPLVVRVGRQDMAYGAERFVSPLRWANTRRRFDAVKLFWTTSNWQFDVFYAKPVLPIRRTTFDRYNEQLDFYGAYFEYKGIPDHGIDAFFFAQDDTQNRTNPNGNPGDMDRYALGGLFCGKRHGFDYRGIGRAYHA